MLSHITWLNQWDASFEKLLQYVGPISNPWPDCKRFNQIINRSARFEMGKGYAKSESWCAQSEIRPMRALDGLVTKRSMVNRLHMLCENESEAFNYWHWLSGLCKLKNQHFDLAPRYT